MTLSMIAVLAFLSFVFCFAATPLCRDFFVERGWVDHPDADRKLHRTAVPRCGGIPIVLSYFTTLAVAYAFVPSGSTIYVQHRAIFQAVLPATILIFLVGFADDVLNLRPRYKLLGQAIASCIAVSLGARISLHHGPAWLGWIVSFFWLLACTNAVNLIDGMDGLATGVGLTATLTTAIAAVATGNIGLAVVTAPLIGALLAFLRYNFAPATIFLGDSGSLTIGFLLGCLGLVWSGHMGGWGMLGPLFTMALPLLDVSLSIGRRFLRRVPIFKADRGHIHHRVQDLGLSTRGAALVLYSCCIVFAALSAVQNFYGKWLGIGFVALFVALVLLGVRRLEYVEFRAVRRMLSRNVMWRELRQQIHLEDMRRALERASTPDECWAAIRRTCHELEVATVQLKLGTRHFAEHRMPHAAEPRCTIHVPLGEDNWIVLMGSITVAPRAISAALLPLQLIAEQQAHLQAADVSLRTAA